MEELFKEFPSIIAAFIFCFGACVGSFLNVCIYRIPAGLSIIRPASRCACGVPIKGFFNIPIFGWLILRGKASCCGRKISMRYPIVELLTAIIFLILWLSMPADKAIVGMLFSSLMIFCTFVDIDTMTLPDAATVGGVVVGFIISCALPSLHDALIGDLPYIASSIAGGICSLTGIVVGAGAVYCVRLAGEIAFGREAMGEGDIILVACVGAFCGWQGAIFSLFGGAVLGSVILLPLLLLKGIFSKAKKYSEKNKKEKKKSKLAKSDNSESADSESAGALEIPFGPWIALGGLVYYIFLSNAVDAYFAGLAEIFMNSSAL